MMSSNIVTFSQTMVYPDLPINEDMAWFQTLLGRLPRGTNILCSGDPGVGKSTLLQQIALSAAACGEKVLYITTEQAAGTVMNRLEMLGSTVFPEFSDLLSKSITVLDDLMDLSLLPTLLSRHIQGMSGKYHGTTIIAIDSLHGAGATAQDRKYWNAIYEYFRHGAGAGITTIALAHRTKGNRIAGPRTLEHQVDVTMLLRPGVSCRSLFVPKNRNGSSRTEPFVLTICPETTRIIPSTLSKSSSASVETLGEGSIVPMEVSISIPKHERGYVKACGLPGQEIDAVISVLESSIRDAHAIRNYGVIVRGPAYVGYRRDQNLAVSLATLAALTRTGVKERLVAVGDISLKGQICGPSEGTLSYLENIMASGDLPVDIQLLTGPGIGEGHPIRERLPIKEVSNLDEAWSWCQR